MATRSLNVVITGDTKSLDRAVGSSESKLGKFAKVSAVAGAAVGGALVAGLAKAVSSAADFESQLDALGAVSNATAGQMETLRKQAIDAGAATKFSALEAAKAQTELAKGGLDLKTILDGGLKGALALAAAGEMDLADAASTTANALNLFKLNGKQAGHVADALAQAANSTTADVSDFSMALTQGGAAAKAAGLDLDQTVVGLEALATAGVKGADAGTSLKSALTQMANPTKKGAAAAKELGLNFFDAAGKMKPLNSISAELQNSFAGLTQKQRLQAAANIAGTDGMRTILALFDAGPQKVTKYWQELQKQGTAAEVAAKKQDNLKGKIENLKGSMETLAIIVGSKLIPPLTKATELATAFLNKLQTGQGTIGAVSQWLSGAAAAVGAFGERVRATFSGGDKGATGSLTKFATNARQFLGLVTRAVSEVGAKVSAVFSDSGIGHNLAIIGRAFLKIEGVASTVFLFIARHTIPIFVGVIEGLATVVKGVVAIIAGILSGDFSKSWDGAKDIVKGAVKVIVSIVKGLAGLLLDAAKKAGAAVGKGILDGIGDIGHAILHKVTAALDWVAGKVKGAGGAIGNVLGLGDGIGDGLGKSIRANMTPAFGGGLMGARPSMAPFAGAASRFGLHVSSGLRPGAITSSGNKSYHSSGEAIDVAGPAAGMMGFFRQMKSKYGSRLAELIYGPGRVGVKDGHPYNFGAKLNAQHMDHVHVAYDTGVPGVGDGIGQIKALWTRAGGSSSEQNMAAAISMAESGGNPNASNRNSDGSIDRGLWQINSVHGALSTFDPLGNAKAAVSISSNGRNWNPWTVFKTGAYKRFLGAAGGTQADGGSGGSSKSGPKQIKGGFASGGGIGKYDPSVVYATENDAAGDPFTLSDAAAARAFIDARGGKSANRPLKGGGPTKGHTQEEQDALTAALANMPTLEDFANSRVARARLTPGTEDDRSALENLLQLRQTQMDAALGDSNPRNDEEAINAFLAVKDSLDQLNASTQENTRALQDSLDALAAEMKRNREFGEGVQSTSNYQLTKTLADILSGHIVGRGVVGRAFTPGTGVAHAY